MIKHLLFAGLVLVSATQSPAQLLPRKGSLGVSFYQNPPDSVTRSLQYKEGAIVQIIHPNTTAAAIGLKAHDIITRVNNSTVSTPAQLLAVARTLRENETINVSVVRQQAVVQLSGKVVARPKETSATAQVVYGQFAYQQGMVRTIYKAPNNKTPLGTIYFLQGLPCYSMDNFTPLDKTKQAIDAMVENGFAVYRIEKADMGDNINMPPCETMGFNEELKMYIAGYQHLLTLPGVDTSKLILFGHSMGGVTAPLIAEKFNPKAVVVYGTVFKPWMQYLMDACLLQPQLYGEDSLLLQQQLDAAKPYIYEYFNTAKTVEEICQTKAGREAMQLIMSYNPQTKLGASGRAALVHKELNQHNLTDAWARTNAHVLAIYGECDIAAINPTDTKALIAHVNNIHPGKGYFWLAPRTTHTFEEIGTMPEFIEWQKDLPAYYNYAAGKFNPKVFTYACDWMKEVLRKG
jgi:pimeloyl-ACP methyl ester carboxylesterase